MAAEPEITAPLIVMAHPHKLRSQAMSAFGLGTLLTGIGAVLLLGRAFDHAITWITLLIGVLFLGLGAMVWGVSRGRPVAIRIDAHGLSGYYVPTLDWADVARIGLDDRRAPQMCIALHNPLEVRNRQSALMWRLNLIGAGRRAWHLVVPASVLEADVTDVVTQAQAFHRAAQSAA